MEAWLTSSFSALPFGPTLAATITWLALVAAAFVSYWLALRLIEPLARRLALKTPGHWDDHLIRRGFFRRVVLLVPAITMRALALAWLSPAGAMQSVMLALAHAGLLLVGLAILYALLDALGDVYHQRPYANQMPLLGLLQAIKLVGLVVMTILLLSMLLGKSPTLLVSGLGAMTAVLMLVFKDPILGFVAGIQLSANRMLAVGDWLEMPKYQADGDVTEITLTTVKVRNWDKTITTIPTYALIADSFKNWRGMQETGGRRIKRSLFIDMQSVRFLDADDLARLRKAQLITTYIDRKIEEIDRFNRAHQVDPSSPANGRRLTNLGTFRAYLEAYIHAHPSIHRELIAMVRQLQPTSEGLPLEIYAFTNDTAWANYESIQADIFDHVLAVVPAFGLRVFQVPAGHDVRDIGLPPRPDNGVPAP